MRLFGLLFLLLCGLVPICAAGDSSRQSLSYPLAAANAFSAEVLPTAAISRHLSQLPPSDRADWDYALSDSAREGNVMCFTMHAFLVKREGPHSDVVDPVGQSTCLSGSKYSVKKAEEPGEAPPR